MSEFGGNEPIEVWWFDESKENVDVKISQDFVLQRIPETLKDAMNWDEDHEFGFKVTSSNSIEVYSKTKEVQKE